MALPKPQPDAMGPPLVERSGQVAALHALLASAASGAGRVAVIRGDAGAGKSALLRSFLADLPAGLDAAVGYCDGIVTPRPLSPFHDLARSLGSELAALLDRPAGRDALRDHLLTRYAQQPVLIAIEDIQWADDATLELVRTLARRIHETAALLVVTFREEPNPTRSVARLMAQLATTLAAQVIEVPPLSRGALAQLARGTAVDPDMLHRLTGGNAFFVTELLAAGTSGLPRSVRDLVRGRIAELDARARAALEAAAVLGARSEAWLLAAVAGESLPGVDDAVAAGLVHADGGEIVFRHELTRIALLDDLPVIRAIGLHRAALAAMRRGGVTDLARLAHHADGASDRAAVLEYAPRAARQAVDGGAFREATAQLRRALRYSPGPDATRAELLEQLGDAEMVTSNGTEADEAWVEALAIRRATGADDRCIGDLLRRIRQSAMWRADFARAMASVEQAVALLEPLGDSRELARARAALSGQLMMEARSEEAIAEGERALAVADRVGDVEARVGALTSVACAELGLGLERGLEKLERCVDLAAAHGLWFAEYRARFNLAAGAASFQRLERANGYYDQLEQFAASTEVLSCNVDANRADVLLALGRWPEAEARARAANAVVDGSLDPLDSATAHTVLARLEARRGGVAAREHLDAAAQLLERTDDLYRQWAVVGTRAEIAWIAGSMAMVVDELRLMLDRAASARDPWMAAEIARWLQRAGALPDPLPACDGPSRHALAGDWRRAADEWRERGNPYEAALALLEADDASALREAHAILRELGATAVVPKVAERLRELGAPVPRGPRRSTRGNPRGLTDRELEVARLVAEGLTNRQIAETLVVSERTVGHHVSAILGRLGVERRSQVASRLDTPG